MILLIAYSKYFFNVLLSSHFLTNTKHTRTRTPHKTITLKIKPKLHPCTVLLFSRIYVLAWTFKKLSVECCCFFSIIFLLKKDSRHKYLNSETTFISSENEYQLHSFSTEGANFKTNIAFEPVWKRWRNAGAGIFVFQREPTGKYCVSSKQQNACKRCNFRLNFAKLLPTETRHSYF